MVNLGCIVMFIAGGKGYLRVGCNYHFLYKPRPKLNRFALSVSAREMVIFFSRIRI